MVQVRSTPLEKNLRSVDEEFLGRHGVPPRVDLEFLGPATTETLLQLRKGAQRTRPAARGLVRAVPEAVSELQVRVGQACAAAQQLFEYLRAPLHWRAHLRMGLSALGGRVERLVVAVGGHVPPERWPFVMP